MIVTKNFKGGNDICAQGGREGWYIYYIALYSALNTYVPTLFADKSHWLTGPEHSWHIQLQVVTVTVQVRRSVQPIPSKMCAQRRVCNIIVCKYNEVQSISSSAIAAASTST